jgi:hypothetical protein
MERLLGGERKLRSRARLRTMLDKRTSERFVGTIANLQDICRRPAGGVHRGGAVHELVERK